MGICSWVFNIFYIRPQSIQTPMPTALIVPPFIPQYSDEKYASIIQKYTKKWYQTRVNAAKKIQHSYESKIIFKSYTYTKLQHKIQKRIS